MTTGDQYAIMAYTVGLLLLVGYAALLWRSGRRLQRRGSRR